MRTVDIQEAKAMLSEILDQIEQGGHVIIARNGEPVTELRAVRKQTMAQAVAAFRSENSIKPSGLKIRDLVDDGRRRF